LAAGGASLPIHAQVEKTVSTRTYVNSLAVNQLAAMSLANDDLTQGWEDLRVTSSGLIEYLGNWEEHLRTLQDRLPPPRTLVLLGRGASLASAQAGALILGEASKFAAIGMQAGEFRHGPLELVSPDLTVILFAGPEETREINRRLHRELNEAGARALWVSPAEADEPGALPVPVAQGIGLPLAEILPVQLLTIHVAVANRVEPGKFFRVGKITLSE
jgi:glucosamine--fructose-6-phosphate aminotransferase (isomerizing)